MFYVKSNMGFDLTEAVKLLLLIILQNDLTRVANVMYFYWTSIKLLIKFPTLVYVTSYISMEFVVHFYPGFKLFCITDPST